MTDTPELTAEEQSWLEQFALAAVGDYNKLPMRIPPRIQLHLRHCLERDNAVRQLDGARYDGNAWTLYAPRLSREPQ